MTSVAFPRWRAASGALIQAALVLALVLAGAWLVRNLDANLTDRGIRTGFGFIERTAGFAIGESTVAYSPADTYGRAIVVGLLNTLKVSALSILSATLLGFGVGLARLSPNVLLRGAARGYVELLRNVPLLVQLLFWYALLLNALPPVQSAWQGFGAVLSNRGLVLPIGSVPVPGRFDYVGGWTLSTELLTLVLGLSTYTSAYVGEIVRGGLLSVPLGQREAATALGLGRVAVMMRVVLPQGLRAMLPPLTSWYLNTVKNSSLAIAVGYPDLVSVADTIINQTGQAIEGVALIIAVYLAVNLALSAVVNAYNRRIALRGAAPGITTPAPVTPPLQWRNAGLWTRRYLASTPANAVTSVVVAGLAVWLAVRIFDWAWFSAVFGRDASACRVEGTGACWPFLLENYRLILFGLYPGGEQWRMELLVGIFAVLLGASFWRRLWGRPLGVLWLGGLVVMYVLLSGGVLGLERVPTEKWSGLPLTLWLATIAVVAAFPLAIVLALGRRSSAPVARAICTGFIELVRGIPLLAVLFMAAVMLPLFMPAGVELGSLARVQIALTLFTAAYMAEAIRGGLQAVPPGQLEAARALGLSTLQANRTVVLPQALRASLPGLVNTAISEVKNTTLVLIVGMFDLLQTTRQAFVAVEWRPYFVEAYAFTAAVFFVLCFTISQLSLKLERHLESGASRAVAPTL
jgi:general L-amino acid transport system permease protein